MLWVEVVGQFGLQRPDLVEQQPFCGGIVAVIARHGAHCCPVLLLDVTAVVLVARPDPGKGDLAFLAPLEQLVVDEFRSGVGVHAQDRKQHLGPDVVKSNRAAYAMIFRNLTVSMGEQMTDTNRDAGTKFRGPDATDAGEHDHPAPTNGFAIAALVSSLVIAPLGIVFGHLALRQIRRTGAAGRGLAIAGLVIGYLGTAVAAVLAIVSLIALLSGAADGGRPAGSNSSGPDDAISTRTPIAKSTGPLQADLDPDHAGTKDWPNMSPGDCVDYNVNSGELSRGNGLDDRCSKPLLSSEIPFKIVKIYSKRDFDLCPTNEGVWNPLMPGLVCLERQTSFWN